MPDEGKPNWRGAPRKKAQLASHSVGGWFRRGRRGTKGLERGLGFAQDAVGPVFPEPKDQKGYGSSQDQQLGAAGNLGLRLPTEELRGHEESEKGPAGE